MVFSFYERYPNDDKENSADKQNSLRLDQIKLLDEKQTNKRKSLELDENDQQEQTRGRNEKKRSENHHVLQSLDHREEELDELDEIEELTPAASWSSQVLPFSQSKTMKTKSFLAQFQYSANSNAKLKVRTASSSSFDCASIESIE